MLLTPRLDEAIKLASRLHHLQSRNDSSQTPYVSHLISVAILVGSVTEDEDTIIAGLMHDSLEDVPGYTFEHLVRDCGEKVAQIVSHVTEPLDANKADEEQLPWLLRKETYLASLRKGGIESALVSSADKIHNTESFLRDFEKEGEAYAMRFGSSIKNRLWFHQEVLSVVAEKLGETHPLIIHFRQVTDRLREVSVI